MRGSIVRHAALTLVVALAALGTACGDGGGRAASTPLPPPDRFAVGRAATAEEIAAWDLDVDPSGHGLPAGQGTPEAGAPIFAAKCASCHGAKGEGQATFPKLVQPPALDSVTRDSFPFDRDFKIAKTAGNYWPYATTLFDYVRHTMPYPQPGSLTPDETYAVVAYLLEQNKVIAPGTVLDATSLPKVAMPARGRFVLDDRKGGSEFK